MPTTALECQACRNAQPEIYVISSPTLSLRVFLDSHSELRRLASAGQVEQRTYTTWETTPDWLSAPFTLFESNSTQTCEASLAHRLNSPLVSDVGYSTLPPPHPHLTPPQLFCRIHFLGIFHYLMLILTSCRLISWVEKVPFWWMSRVSDHRVLFLLFGGVGAAALLHGFWGPPGVLPSPRSEACGCERGLCRFVKPSCDRRQQRITQRGL